MKIIMLGDIHGPMTDEQKKQHQEAAKNTVILRGDMMDHGGPINKEILKYIPVITLKEALASLTLSCQNADWPRPIIVNENFDTFLSKGKKK